MSVQDQSPPHDPVPNSPIERLTYRFAELALALGVSKRTLERQRGSGKLLKPSIRIGKTPLWFREHVRDWLARGGR